MQAMCQEADALGERRGSEVTSHPGEDGIGRVRMVAWRSAWRAQRSMERAVARGRMVGRVGSRLFGLSWGSAGGGGAARRGGMARRDSDAG